MDFKDFNIPKNEKQEYKEMAMQLFALYEAFCLAGFTKKQALTLVIGLTKGGNE